MPKTSLTPEELEAGDNLTSATWPGKGKESQQSKETSSESRKPRERRRPLVISASNDLLYLVCSDDTMWYLDTLDPEASEWKQLPSVP